MPDSSSTSADTRRDPLFTPPSLPKGGGTVSVGGGMLSVGSADGAAGWSLPLPLPSGRELSPELALNYSSGGGNDAFGAGWICSLPVVSRMSRFGIPRYTDCDRLAGPDGEEILRDNAGSRTESTLPFSTVNAPHTVTPWVSRSGGRGERLEHWRADATPDAPGFWLHYHADGSLTLLGWSASARLSDPDDPSHVATWYPEETVSAKGEHLVYTYRTEDDANCDAQELAAHSRAANVYLAGVHALNATPSQALLVPEGAFRPEDFMSVMLLDYGERDTPVDEPPPFQTSARWPARLDRFGFWRWGFNVRMRRLCRDVLLWHRTAMMAGEKDSTPVLVSRLHLTHQQSPVATVLESAQQVAYEPDGTPLILPPMEFELSRPGREAASWEALPDLDGFSPPRWQMADLHGEGLAGLLYQEQGAWRYRAPERKDSDEIDAVTWGEPQPLPFAPALESGTLTDLDGDGRPEWLVAQPGLHGHFTLSPDGQWSRFIPLQALPTELLHPSAQRVDLTGDGLLDVAMIGPRSVRLWASAASEGWRQSVETAYLGKTPLPVEGGEDRLVAFADLVGSGQQHLVEITGERVTYWPSLGHGRFGEAIGISGFAVEDFRASRVLLGDTDGSGTTDILYLEADRVRVFVSESGNRFVERAAVPAPEGVVLDDTCVLQVTDLRGQGTAELVLTLAHMAPRTWTYRFNDRRPWLLAQVCTNTGSRTLFDYRSSAQGWLDEKAVLKAQGKPAVSLLPFPVHMLSRVIMVDDISGLRTVSGMTYLRGIWDGIEREFRGFTRLIQTDTLVDAQGTAPERSPPAQVRTWFLSGIEAHDATLEGIFAGSGSAESDFAVSPLRITQLQADGQEVPYAPEGEARRWLLRALKGMPVRTETYGLDGSDRADVPYSITRQRWQVRAYETAHPAKPAALVTPVESLTLTTERIAQDPVVSQRVILEQDLYGSVLKSVDIRYPRRDAVTPSPYPDTLPEGLEAASRDAQQNAVWLTLSRQRVRNLHAGHIHLTGLSEGGRTDVLHLESAQVPEGGFTVESLLAAQGPLARLDDATLGGYSRVQWCDMAGDPVEVPVRQALVAYTETALLEQASLAAFEGHVPEAELERLLKQGGYRASELPEDGKRVYLARHGLARYTGAEGFYRLVGARDSELTGETVVQWTPHGLAVQQVTDAAGLCTRFSHDWRFMTVMSLIDPNDNVLSVAFDALGRVVQSRFHGTENGEMAGYHPTQAFDVPKSMAAMLSLKGGEVPVHTAHLLVTDSWMPPGRDAHGRIQSGRVGELAYRRFARTHGLKLDLNEGREPPHIINLLTDRYDGDPDQQVRISVTYSDGGGRALQTAVLHAPGDALVRTDEGELEVDEGGKAVIAHAVVRWAVSGKTEYDNKGQPVRTWLPFYLNDWRPVDDQRTTDGLYADTHLYDATGRVCRVITAAGYERRTQYYPWFTVSEDENDTA
ncbi:MULTISPECIES: SpvB/TcaC N-terminal domain-containing protein [Pseudomonas]|uniref:Mono(ADP-ribosyl)transferase SpvB n=1 Tax=Pseudomonas putida TaxID=303 RepID=A0A1B2F538_PSEPU|nr:MULTISPECIES: SpvB/TcaC N-terminal domain-containing protein [Pseudomonas]ANY87307.1 Mono(ADP-ribosyl)transferase SpvB [Pseudomonas putida]MCL8305037.1 hypothetical protein [Pseudomonas putida]